jgi:hypothetical protein
MPHASPASSPDIPLGKTRYGTNQGLKLNPFDLRSKRVRYGICQFALLAQVPQCNQHILTSFVQSVRRAPPSYSTSGNGLQEIQAIQIESKNKNFELALNPFSEFVDSLLPLRCGWLRFGCSSQKFQPKQLRYSSYKFAEVRSLARFLCEIRLISAT